MQGPTHILTGRAPLDHARDVMRDLRSRRASNTVKNPDFRILEVISGLAAYHRKTYTTAGQKKLLELIKAHTGRSMSRRTLNRHLNALCQQQFMRRIRRHRRDRRRGYVFRSTICVPMWQACRRMAKNAAAIFLLVGQQLGQHPSVRVTKMAQYLNRFYKSFISAGGEAPG